MNLEKAYFSENDVVLEALQHYFRQSAMTRQIPLPRWAIW